MSHNVFEKIELPGVKNIIVIASGKGGVGKSTVSANLAVAMARQGHKVALVDADLYGPSIPIMMGVKDERPMVNTKNGKEMILPIEKYGIKMVSIGFFVEPGQSLIWRGPMASNGLTQLFRDTDWGVTDYMIVDFPPGTGDIQLTSIQKLNLTGAIIVTTPQEVALSDARKAAAMFSNPGLQVPILGVIENMSWFTPVQHPDEKYFIFGQGGGERLATEFHTELLGRLPLIAEIGEASDQGINIYNTNESAVIKVFDNISSKLTEITN